MLIKKLFLLDEFTTLRQTYSEKCLLSRFIANTYTRMPIFRKKSIFVQPISEFEIEFLLLF